MFNHLVSIFFLMMILISVKATELSLTDLADSKSVSLIYVGGKGGPDISNFGHIGLSFSKSKKHGNGDIIVNFAAELPKNRNAVMEKIKGIGLSKKLSYKTKMEITSFYNYQEIKNKRHNQTITLYPLLLTPVEIQKVIDYLTDFSMDSKSPRYTYFDKNCSYYVARAIEKATHVNLDNISHPWRLPKQFKLKKLIDTKKEIIVYEASKNRRKAYIKQSFEDSPIIENELKERQWDNTFIDMLEHPNLHYKITTYQKLLILKNELSHNQNAVNEIDSLFRRIYDSANGQYKNFLKYVFKNKDIITKMTDEISYHNYQGTSRILKHKLKIYKKRVIVEIFLTGSSDNDNRSVYRLNLKGYSVKNNDIFFDNKKVGHLVSFKGEEWPFIPSLSYGLDHDTRLGQIRLFVSFNPNEIENLDLRSNKGVLALDNNRDFGDDGKDSCYALVLLQKALEDRAIFLPNLPRVKNLKITEIVKSLYEGKIVLIAGFSDIHDFTSNIDKEILIESIHQHQEKIDKNLLNTIFQNLFKRQKINSSSVKHLVNLTDAGYSVPLIIGFSNKGQRKLQPKGHIVLVHSVKKMDDFYELKIYDPNIGLDDSMLIDKEFHISYPFFPAKYDAKPFIDTLTRNEVETIIGMSRRIPKINELELLVDKNKGYLEMNSLDYTNYSKDSL